MSELLNASELLDRLKSRIDGADGKDELLSELLTDAGDAIKAYTCRDYVPDCLVSAQVRLAAILFNRQGMEGESSHSEGGVSVASDALPEEIKAQIRPYRLARTMR
ncbi:MAG: phage head-tail connector protein [Eubacteriales bacterium]|nr:phage head-tail connector protein [Eubacteriales bacterium]MDD3882331.1 phage head-tail connector protein [Eubacteriales bacterium]MDD4512077.1 phage head-tail connector protein [Eubacteriales bacterium]